MRTIKKEFNVYLFEELSLEAQHKAVQWYADNEVWTQDLSDIASQAALSEAQKYIRTTLADAADEDQYQIISSYDNSTLDVQWDDHHGCIRDIDLVGKPGVTLYWSSLLKELRELGLSDHADKLFDIIGETVFDIIYEQADHQEDVIRDILSENDYEFTKYGKFYRD